MAEVDLKHAVEMIGSDTIRARTEGLEELKHILRQYKGTQRLKPLRDDAYHGIFEAVFRLVRSEKPEYLRTNLPKKKSTIATRLGNSASVLRLAVEIGVPVISHKTAVAVIDHIRDTLPVADEGYCLPLRNDYLKSLRAILEYPSHVEHLRRKHWQSLNDFLVAGIQNGSAEDTSSKNGASGQTESQDSRNGRYLSVRTSQHSSARSLGSQPTNSTAELLISLRLLTSATNAPLMTRAASILPCLTEFLEYATISQHDAFEGANNILSTAITEDISLARSTVFGLLPVIRRLWSTKSSALKDQMVITLTLGHGLLAAQDGTRLTESEHLSLINLLDVLVLEYQRRTDREMLTIDDLRFTGPDVSQPVGLQGIVPLIESGRALSNWSVVSIIACLSMAVDSFQSREDTAELSSGTSRKRRKVTSRVDEIVSQALAGTGSEKSAALQIIIFLMKESEGAPDTVAGNMLKLAGGILEDDSAVASWSMLLFAQFSRTSAAGRSELRAHWIQVWQWATRNLSAPGTSRAACYLLEAIFSARLLDAIATTETMDATLFSESLSAFCGLSDSSLSLWRTVLMSRLSDNPASADKIAIRTVNWLTANWNMPSVLDRLQNAQTAFHAQPDILIELLTTCTERTLPLASVTPSLITSKIYRAYFRTNRDEELIKYLICNTGIGPIANTGTPRHTTVVLSEQLNGHAVERTVLEMLLAKLKSFRDAWLVVAGERASNINPDMVYIVASLCVVTKVFLTRVNGSHSTASKEAGLLTEQVWDMVCNFVSRQDADTGRSLLASMASVLLAIQAKDEVERRVVHRSLSTLSNPLLNILRPTLDSQDLDAALQQDSIDMEDSFISEASQNVTEVLGNGSVREDLPFSCDERSALVCMTVELFLNQTLANEQDEFDPATYSAIVDFFINLSPAHLLAAHQPIVRFLSEATNLTRTDAVRVLKKLAAGCMQDDDFERCEASLCLCLDAMTALASLWASGDEDDLRAVALDMYSWFLEVALGKGLASSNVLKRIAGMLEAVLQTNALFNQNTSLRSPRTSLFQILRAGDNSVKYHVAKRICHIFDRFVLTEHEAILDDVVESLPSDPENIEGIAVRLSILATLAAKWNTLLRRSVYHVFETAAQVPQSVPFAQVCLRKLCVALGLSSPREIFLLFCPQILYTWLENEHIDSIPFAIYDFGTLTQLLSAAQLELVGQIAMRGSTEQAQILAQKLDVPWEDMLRASFAKAEAYTIARDISIPPRENSAKSTESLLRRQLGNESYIQLVGDLFPDIVATLFVTLGEEHGIERAFSKRPRFGSAKSTLSAITSLSHSEVVLPVGQQPTFRAKFLLDELDFLCQRIDVRLESIWDSPLVVHVSRTLLDSAVPALGSLYACAMLRKLRIVVSMAQSTALKGYPVEMLLHAIRPYLTVFHCAEDALGLFWFLLDQGKAYLQSRPSFMIGLAVATFISLTKFLNSTQESTTQESHFRATMSRAQMFHKWFTKYLESFQPLDLTSPERDAFQRFAVAASGMRKLGSAIKGSHGGDLMLELFDDRTSKRHLLSEASFTLALELACSDFELPAKPRDDILGDDAAAVDQAPVIWDIILHLKVGSGFRTWAAQTLGRAYAATGSISDKLSREHDVTQFQSAGEEPRPGSNSDSAIMHRLQAMLFTNDRIAAGQAERTLEMIITQLHADGTISLYDSDFDAVFIKDLQWSSFPCPLPSTMPPSQAKIRFPQWDTELRPEEWASRLALALCLEMRRDPVLLALRHVLSEHSNFAEEVLPAVVHKVLLSESDGRHRIRQTLSDTFNDVLKHHDTVSYRQVRLVNSILLYLRCQPFPRESTLADRLSWLDVDLGLAAAAAAACQAYKTAILFLELLDSQRHLLSARSSRRSSLPKLDDLATLVQSIFQKLDDPDFFYGVQEKASVASVLQKLDHEGAGLQKLSFQSAMYDSSLKCSSEENEVPDASGIMSALSAANLDGLARAVQMHQKLRDDKATTDSVLSIGLNLHQWDLPALPSVAPSTKSAFMTFRQLRTSRSQPKIVSILNQGLLESLNQIEKDKRLDLRAHQAMSTLAMLTEVKETLASSSMADLDDQWETMTTRTKWMKFESFERSRAMILGREALFSAIRRNDYLQSLLKISHSDSQLFEVKIVRESLRVAEHHEISQSALNRAMYLSKLASIPANSGLKIESIAQYDLAKILWDQGQRATSIQMLRQLKDRDDLRQGAFAISRSEILADLGQRTAEARLSKPDEIIAQCLVPAIKALNGSSRGSEAGRVFHDFAAFCDLQLQNADDKDDFHRIETIRHRKEKEILDLQRMIEQEADIKRKAQFEQHLANSQKWFKLDDEEYRRLQKARENLVQQSLENYLLSLRACDDYRNDVLRFCALWLDQSESKPANIAVSKHISKVASRKFAPLMSQLASRLLDENVDFQLLLFELLWRICCDHPYHGMYQVFVSSKTRGARTDDIATSRNAAARKLADKLVGQPSINQIWIAIHNISILFVHFAQERLEEQKHKAGAKALLQELKTGSKLVQAIEQSSTKIPPPTMKIPLRNDCNYSSITTFSKFEPYFSVAGGISAPKIVTVIGTDGQRYKMLLKGGNDDLRQDSIMEQVFEQVSNLLQDHRATRQRQLGIRTYKVLPLTQNAGIIEFVKDTIPLHEYSLPAHQRYFPKDYKPNRCRKDIQDAQTKSLAQRVQAYRNVVNNFHPVLRFFFMEHFLNPDDWFVRRLAYSRSTAAISILGYVLGLGDRHGHNILLDEQTGEVVHIDLGVAFETGRVLPVPETVPFRLTRDIVDGMGLSGVEGVFRRCCNFTLEALRQDQYSIMTILDVLRYDPLYSWSVSPLRLQRMQENQGPVDGNPTAAGTLGKSRDPNEPSEADRALTVVEKKLGRSLSVEATVNELIRQATDELNLATLYFGWSAYA